MTTDSLSVHDAFTCHLDWTGAVEGATSNPASFSRDLTLSVATLTLPMSSAPGYRGDGSRANPEQLFVAAISACQALTYLFLAAKNGVRVVGYTDDAEGRLGVIERKLRLSHVVLRPHVTVEAGVDEALARGLVARAHSACFIANSVSTTIDIEPTFDTVSAEVTLS